MGRLARRIWGLTAIAGVLLASSCSNPAAPPPGNTAPQVSFYDLQATNAGTTEVNGYYRENGANESRPKYDLVTGGWYLYYFTSNDPDNRWVIHSNILAAGSASLGAVYYYATTTPQTAPTGVWNRTTNGLNPSPTLARMAITGTLSAGNLLTGTYNYSDAESDADDSVYQWKQYATATDTGAGTNCTGTGAATLSYTVDGSDSGLFLRLQVTPRDDRGATGTSVLSGAVPIS